MPRQVNGQIICINVKKMFNIIFCFIGLYFAKISIAKIKRYPDIGSPWRQPRWISKGVEMFPFIILTALNFFSSSISNIILIHVLKVSAKSKISKVVSIKSKLTESNAFSKSISKFALRLELTKFL